MTGQPATTVESLLCAYLDRVAAGLHGSRRHRARILAELRDGLDEATCGQLAAGLRPERAATAAIASFGAADQVAAAFAGELATAWARRTLAGYVVTGPLVGIWWLLLLHPEPLSAGLVALVAAVPVLPLVAAGIAVSAGTVATTGRLMRWLPETGPRGALAATTAVAALAATGDLLIIAVYAGSAIPVGPLAGLAVTASLIRVGCSLYVAGRSRALRRRLV